MDTLVSILSLIDDNSAVQPILLTGPATTQWDDVEQRIRSSLGRATEQISITPDGSTIKIRQVRDLLGTLSRTAFTAKRLVWIAPIDRIELAAANALLKELEETAEQNRFILATSFPGRVLPTIISRCQVRRFSDTKGSAARTDSSLPSIPEILSSPKKDSLTEDELQAISAYLTTALQENTANPYARLGLMRLRDFYKIRAFRGNQKLAVQVLLATLSQMRNTREVKS